MTELVESEDSGSKMPIWQIRDTCYVSTHKQCSEDWARERIGCIPASMISKVCGRTNFSYTGVSQTPEELAEIICGLSSESFDPYRVNLMEEGIRGEPVIKQWYSNRIINRPITDIGVAVWKQNPYFRASLDGETIYDGGEPAAVEVKIPRKLNPVYIDVLQSWGKGLRNPHPSEYIFASHYDQMTAGSVITNKHGCYYIVACIRTKECFHQYIETDYEHWNTVLYPRAEAFRLKYVVPLLERNNIQVIMPPGVTYESKTTSPSKHTETKSITLRRTSNPNSLSPPIRSGDANPLTQHSEHVVVTTAFARQENATTSGVYGEKKSPLLQPNKVSPIKPKIVRKEYIHPLSQLTIRHAIMPPPISN